MARSRKHGSKTEEAMPPQALRQQRRLSEADYLERELTSSIRHEFVDGVLYAMAGGSRRHDIVTGNIFAALHGHVKEPCNASTANMKVRIKVNASITHYYPDATVSCADADPLAHFIEHPVLIVEVLSPSTERTDRGEKFEAYKTIPSLMEYVLADQDMPKVEIYRRRTAWVREEFYPEDAFTLESVGLNLTVEQVYRRMF